MDAVTIRPPSRAALAPGDGLAVPDIECIDLADGAFILRSRTPARPHARRIGDWLDRWADATPDALFLAERNPDGGHWRKLNYVEVRRQAGCIAQALIDRGLDGTAPIAILSDNSIDIALLKLGALLAGVPYAIVSSSYCRATRDHTKLHAMLRALGPALMYASDGAVYGPAMLSSGLDCVRVFSVNVPDGAVDLAHLLETAETPEVAARHALVDGASHAKYLLTSGSTGKPKVVINTHAMLCANQEAIAQVWPFLERNPPVLLDWLPWSHTYGANHNFNMILRNGGALYIDDGRPVPGQFDKAIRNLREVAPTMYFNVPKGYDALLPWLEQDDELAERFLGGLDVMQFAAAALPEHCAKRLARLLKRHRTTPLFCSSAWGSTETSPLVTSVHFPTERFGNIGVPVPGVELKFVPQAGKLELRVRGPNVFPAYRGAPELTAQAFDEDGFYYIGDAGKLVDPHDPNAGIVFDGRVSEDFKLTTGTWVSVGTLRLAALAALAPYAQDVVVAGHGRDEIGILIFPSPALRLNAGDVDGNWTGAQLAAVPTIQARIAASLASLNEGKGSAARAARARILSAAPDLGTGEITDKGYINQRAVLERRADEVECLFGDAPDIIFPATSPVHAAGSINH